MTGQYFTRSPSQATGLILLISTSERNETLAGTIRGLTIAIKVDRDSLYFNGDDFCLAVTITI